MRTIAIRPAANRADRQPNTITATTTDSEGWRICRQCKDLKPLGDMAVDRSAKDGRRSVCTECRTKYDRARYVANRGAYWLACYRKRSSSYGFKRVGKLITEQALVERWGGHCVYCGGPFKQIDHVIAVRAGGTHILENVVPCCQRCNPWKRWAIDEPLIRLFDALRAVELANQVVDLDLIGTQVEVL